MLFASTAGPSGSSRRTARFSSSEHRVDATAAHAYAKRRVRQLTKTVETLRAKVAMRDARRLAGLTPKAAICAVFGDHCQEAVAVASCESHLSTSAQNGQYLGLFQMGSYERRLFGHGATAHAQAVAAHRYFVRSGRDWSPWSCRWAASLIALYRAKCVLHLRTRVSLVARF